MSLIKLVIFLLSTSAFFLSEVETKSILGIGERIKGDQLLLKDILESRPAGLEEQPKIGFNYAIPEPITYIEIFSEENVLAEVNFSYQNDLVKGTVKMYNTTEKFLSIKPFKTLITIYGFNHTVPDSSQSYILNRDQTFKGILEPKEGDDEEVEADSENEYLELGGETLERMTDNTHVNDNDYDYEDSDEVELEGADVSIDFESKDKTIEVGRRQKGDYLIYETYQSVSSLNQQPTNLTVVFYYIDSNFITCAKFVIFDYYADKSQSDNNPPTAEYSHFSPNTLKTVITDYNSTMMFVQMFLYGYKPMETPVDYVPFLKRTFNAIGSVGTTEASLSLQRLKMLMNANKHGKDNTKIANESTHKVHEVNYDERSDVYDEAKEGEKKQNSQLNRKLLPTSATSMSANLLIVPTLGFSVTFRTLWLATILVWFNTVCRKL